MFGGKQADGATITFVSIQPSYYLVGQMYLVELFGQWVDVVIKETTLQVHYMCEGSCVGEWPSC